MALVLGPEGRIALSCGTLSSFPIGQGSAAVVQRGQRGAEGGLGGWVAGGLVEVWWGEEKAGKEGRLGERLCDPGKRREKRSGLVSVQIGRASCRERVYLFV